MHHWKETGETDPAWASTADVVCLEKKLRITGVRREDWWPAGTGRHEVTFAINLATLELHEYSGPREVADAWKKSFDHSKYLTGTIDWVGYWLGDVWIDDLKTGRWPVHADAPQLLSYGMYSWLIAKQRARKRWRGRRSITQWPRYPLDGLPKRTFGPLMNNLAMLCHVDDLRYSLARPDETNPTDDGCRFCDSRPICPAHAGAETE